MAGVLLDTHAFYWLVAEPDELARTALLAIAEGQRADALYVSAITAWELSVAAQKPLRRGRPDLQGQDAGAWFSEASRLIGTRVVPIGRRIAIEAANVATVYGRKDPGDCFLIATARIRRAPIVSRDSAMRDLAKTRPDYLSVVAC